MQYAILIYENDTDFSSRTDAGGNPPIGQAGELMAKP